MSRRALGALAAVAGGALLLAGCSSAAPEPGSSPASSPSEEALTGSITVLAAASLTETFDALGAAFEAEHPGTTVTFSYGGSSSLAQQIVSGAPADVFAAANESTMQTVDDAGLAVDPTIFATNVLELVVPPGNPGGVTGLADLARPELAIALCDVAVPCGSATQQLLDQEGITAQPDTLEQDVKLVLTKVQLGEADAGLVYVTDAATAGDAVEGIAIPEAQSVVNRYPIATIDGSPNAALAAAFVAFVLSEEGRAALAEAGFGAP